MDRKTYATLEKILSVNSSLEGINLISIYACNRKPSLVLVINCNDENRSGKFYTNYFTKKGARSGALDLYNYFVARGIKTSFEDRIID